MQRTRTEFDANKLLLKVPNTKNCDSLETVLRYYFNDYWYYHHTLFAKASDFIISYLTTIFDNKSFDFAKYSVEKDTVGKKHELYPFIEIEKDHKKCCEKIYFERIYTKFSSTVFTYKGKIYSLLKFFITHRDILKKMKDYDSGHERILSKISENIDKCEITEEQYNRINIAFESFISYFGNLSIYSYDEIVSGNHSIVNLLISLFLEFYIVMNDEKRINKLFEFFHNTGNTKAEAFTKLLKEEDQSENADGAYRERPISGFVRSRYGYGSDSGLSLSELYYFINFYKKFKNGKFLNSVINSKSLLLNYITVFKSESGYRLSNNEGRLDKKFFTQFNSVKPEGVYSLETFERFNTLVINRITGTKVLDILEQDATTLQLCLVDPDLEHSVPTFYFSGYRAYYNFLAYIEYNKLSDQQKQRYWKMISNFINTTTMKSKRLLKILSNLANLHEMTEAELVSNLQPYVLASKQTLLLELYLD